MLVVAVNANPGPVSTVMASNLFTMGCSAKLDSRQAVPSEPMIPDLETRRLRARHVLEEAIETVYGLGFSLSAFTQQGEHEFTIDIFDVNEIKLTGDKLPNLEQIIDGCCDVAYVAVGTLAVCGVPDNPHMYEVCRANDRKFPTGTAIVNNAGKFQKPDGWKGPDHIEMMKTYKGFHLNRAQALCTEAIVNYFKESTDGADRADEAGV